MRALLVKAHHQPEGSSGGGAYLPSLRALLIDADRGSAALIECVRSELNRPKIRKEFAIVLPER